MHNPEKFGLGLEKLPMTKMKIQEANKKDLP